MKKSELRKKWENISYYDMFNEVRTLYNASPDSYNACNVLQLRMAKCYDDGYILYVCPDDNVADICFNKLLVYIETSDATAVPYYSDIKSVELTIDEEKRTIEFIGESIIRYKVATIEEVLMWKDIGEYNFKEIEFYELERV